MYDYNKSNIDILIVIPVFNEEFILESNILRLHKFLQNNLKNDWKIIIADNASFDDTMSISKKLVRKYNRIGYVRENRKGRGRIIRKAWNSYSAKIYCYIDSDLDIHPEGILDIIKQLGEEFDIAVGSKHLKKSSIRISLKRKLISKAYNFLIRKRFNIDFKDMQCGLKGVNNEIINKILPLIKDNNWFFDTELLILAQKFNYKIKEIPVDVAENRYFNRKSKVNLLSDAFYYLKSIKRLKKDLI